MENKEQLKTTEKVLEFFKGIGTIILYFILTIIGTIIFGNLYQSENPINASIGQLGIYSIMLIGLALVYHKRLINDFKNFKKENINIAIRNWLIGLGIMMISNLIITTIVKDIAANESLNRELLMKYPISNIITMVLIGPLIEEITFRASFKKAFTKWYTFATTTGLLFGLAHIASFELLEFLFIIPYGALGFFFAKAFYETNNIYTSFISHMIHNAFCILTILLF